MSGHSWITPKAKGRNGGLYATKPISPGEIVCIFGGYVMTREQTEILPAGLRDYPIKIFPGYYLGQRTTDDFDDAELVNHSCDPSCRIKNTIFLVASRAIPDGGQVTFDYAENDDDFRGFICTCNSANCRGWIGK